MEEIPLGGGWVTQGVVRLGDTVRRPLSERSSFVHGFLVYLEKAGFEGAPRFLGIDEQGRESLTFIQGVAPTEIGTLTDRELHSAARLLRRLHDASAGAPDDLRGGHETVIHGDSGPWNMIWRGEEAVALIDFDEARPGERLEELGYFAWKGLRLKPKHLTVVEQGRRLRVVSDAYGAPMDDDLFDAIDAAYEWMTRKGLREGWPDHAVDQVASERTWFRQARQRLRRA
ncbi:MAG TPA: phosphotransferase [Gaiellaceae bacterium]|nr:phosphotransferase [Gaiellaceae bacterium]